MTQYKLVPVEPTQEMKDSGALSVTARSRGDGGYCGPTAGEEFAVQAYKAMLDAAPPSPDPCKALEIAREALRNIHFHYKYPGGVEEPAFKMSHEALRQIDEVMK